MMSIHCLTAVYNRQAKTFKSINDIYQQSLELGIKIKFWIIEAGDEKNTQRIFNKFPSESIKIIKVPDTTYWTSGMHIGLKILKKNSSNEDLVILFNNDIRVPRNTLKKVCDKIKNNLNYAISPISISINSRKSVSTGIKVKNWFLSLHESMFVNLSYKQLKLFEPAEVDFMTQRFLCARKNVFDLVGNYNERILPHYGGDNEFTYRMKKKGIKVILDPSFYIYIDETDTGLNSHYRSLSFKERFQSLFYIKSTSNLGTAIKFSILVAPYYSQPFNLLAMTFKAILRALILKPKK